MKRKLFTMLAIFLASLFVFAACGPTENPDDNPNGPGDTTTDGEWLGPVDEGSIRIVLYYNNPQGYDRCDVWMWNEGLSEGSGYAFETGDFGNGYGGRVQLTVTDQSTRIGYIIRRNIEPGNPTWPDGVIKDGTGDDRFIPVDERFIKNGQITVYCKYDNRATYIRNAEGVEEEMKLFDMADMITPTRITCLMNPTPSTLATLNIKVRKLKSGDETQDTELKISSVIDNIIVLDSSNPLSLSEAYVVSADGYGEAPVVPNTYFDRAEFKNEYTYDGTLGVEIADGVPTFRLWAPTASKVVLNIYAAGNGGEAEEKIELTKGEKGVYSYTGKASHVGKYYTYTVTTSLGEQEAVDPYAVSGGVNGDRGMVLDLNDASTLPTGWSGSPFTVEGYTNYTDAEIWEVHIRDFSNKISSLRDEYKGKYMAFTQTGLTENGIPVGTDYLKDLGITHVHLQPAFDYSSVDETKNEGFNWGYDPKNYNMPEGSFATDAYDGKVRVKEFREMVQALHNNGMGVVMDVVYNHTSGLQSNFQKIVPYYYYRFNASTGKPANGSGCGNETASDRSMFRKYMVESVEHWMKNYNVDGFRFDLMGLHDTDTMQAIEAAVHAINPNAIIYGEGWDAGSNALPTGTTPSNLNNLKIVNSKKPTNGIAMFNNTTRDALKGSTNGSDPGFATGALSGNAGRVAFGVYGGTSTTYQDYWTSANPTQVISYASAHDNLTLWDKIVSAHRSASDLEDNLRRNRLTAAIIQTSLGVPFMLAGEEMLRTKTNADGTFNANSYNASDDVNNLKWSALTSTSNEYQMSRYYKGLIAFRKAHATLRSPSANVVSNLSINGTLITFQMSNGSETLFVVYNAGTSPVDVTLPAGNWDLYVNGTTAGTTPLTFTTSVEKISCYVYVKK